MSNLIPGQHKLTVDEQSQGGKRSAEVRQQRKRAREIAEVIFSLPLHAGETMDIDDARSLDDCKDMDSLTVMIASLVRKATEGSVRHAELLLTLTGDYSKKVDLKNEIEIENAETTLQDYFDNVAKADLEANARKVNINCLVNKYTYAMYTDPSLFRDFSTADLEDMLTDIYTYGIDLTETWGKPLDKGALIDHIRKQLLNRQPTKPAKSVDEILERTKERVKYEWESER